VRLAAPDPTAQNEMNARRSDLAANLTQSGIDLVSFKVTGRGDD
jgi:hypothetical protein